MAKKAYIILEDGHIFCGKRFGADKETIGEIVFTTGMGGYIETLTDPSYYGQIILQTFPLIGNYGMIAEDYESNKTYASGYIVKQWCDSPSNFRSEQDVDLYLKSQGIPGIYDVDTREITRIIREHGTMPAKIVDEIPQNATEGLNEYKIIDAVKTVSLDKKMVFEPAGEKKFKVALLDYGAKHNIVRALVNHGCEVISMPYDTKAEEILSLGVDGLMLSNGPGDPSENIEAINEIGKLLGKIPIFGICLGHQMLAIAAGGKTIKLKYGHRGVNQPVKDLESGRVYITSQNHSYAVAPESLASSGAKVSHINVNDGTCEGVVYPDKKAFSAQFHPEACSGPRDTELLFDKFLCLMGGAY